MARFLDIGLNPATGDISFVDGELVFVEDLEAIRSDVESALKFFRGEWFLDVSVGVPWLSDIFVKNPDLDVVRAALRDVILARPGIVGLTSLDLTLDRATRRLAISFAARADLGAISGTVEVPT